MLRKESHQRFSHSTLSSIPIPLRLIYTMKLQDLSWTKFSKGTMERYSRMGKQALVKPTPCPVQKHHRNSGASSPIPLHIFLDTQPKLVTTKSKYFLQQTVPHWYLIVYSMFNRQIPCSCDLFGDLQRGNQRFTWQRSKSQTGSEGEARYWSIRKRSQRLCSQ